MSLSSLKICLIVTASKPHRLQIFSISPNIAFWVQDSHYICLQFFNLRSLHSPLHHKMSEDITYCCYRSRLLLTGKTIAKWIGTHPLYLSYFIFFSPYILKLIYFLAPLLILLLVTALCAFSTSTSNSFRFIHNETQENNISSTPLEAEAYNIIFDTFHNSETSLLSDESDETEACKQIKFDELPPEIVKSCCSSTPLLDPPLHDIATKRDDDEPASNTGQSEDAKSSICNETEIIKHMVCSTINKHQTDQEEFVKEEVEVEVNKAEKIHFTTTTTEKSEESNEEISNSQIHSPSPTSITTDLHRTNRSYDFSSIGSMRREKEWRRTLACKLFEERHNNHGGGEDGMDMLWETHEESVEPEGEYRRSATTVSRRSSQSAKRDLSIRFDEDDDVVDEDDNDDVAGSGKMCCLQALKMSSGKVNLGIKSKNMIKLSKALRGFGWLHKTNSRKY